MDMTQFNPLRPLPFFSKLRLGPKTSMDVFALLRLTNASYAFISSILNEYIKLDLFYTLAMICLLFNIYSTGESCQTRNEEEGKAKL
jgi:hypothetical protein